MDRFKVSICAFDEDGIIEVSILVRAGGFDFASYKALEIFRSNNPNASGIRIRNVEAIPACYTETMAANF